jgi:hypothetical protein
MNIVVRSIKQSLYLLVKQYQQEQKRKSKHENIILGRIFSVGQIYPYILAECLFKDRGDYNVLVDHHINVSRKSLYPDLLVIHRNNAVAVIEVKLDLGWLKDPKNTISKLIKKYNFPSKISYKAHGHKITVIVGKKIKKIFFVVTKANDHSRFKDVEKLLSRAGFQIVYCLEKLHHPNDNINVSDIDGDVEKNLKEITNAFSWLK